MFGRASCHARALTDAPWAWTTAVLAPFVDSGFWTSAVVPSSSSFKSEIIGAEHALEYLFALDEQDNDDEFPFDNDIQEEANRTSQSVQIFSCSFLHSLSLGINLESSRNSFPPILCIFLRMSRKDVSILPLSH